MQSNSALAFWHSIAAGSPASRRGGAARRAGVTLIELLVVILIMLMVTALTIPIVAPAISNRKIREGARMVDVFVNSAKNRSKRTGRPVGVVFEQNIPGGASTLSFAEVPPSYTGDLTASTINVWPSGATTLSSASNSIFTGGDIGWIGLVRPGDLIQFNYRSTLYRIYAGEPYLDINGNGAFDAGTDWFTDTNLNGAYDAAPAGAIQSTNDYLALASAMTPVYTNAAGVKFGAWTYTYADPALAAQYMSVTGGSGSFGPTGAVTFQIRRQPVPLAANKLQLDADVAVDLGTTLINTSAGDAVAIPGSGLDSGTMANFREFPIALYPSSMQPPAPYASRVIVTFNPNGLVDLVYSWDEPAFTTYGGASVGWQGRQVQGPIYFLIGKRELLGGNPELLPLVQAGQAPVEPCFNFQDQTNLWVVINPQTGMVSTVQNAAVDLAAAPPSQTAANRVALQSYYTSQVYQARATARDMRAMGGR